MNYDIIKVYDNVLLKIVRIVFWCRSIFRVIYWCIKILKSVFLVKMIKKKKIDKNNEKLKEVYYVGWCYFF